MWKCGKKFRATKKINILTLVLSEKKILNETKNNNPPSPCKLNDRSLTIVIVQRCLAYKKGLSRSLDLD